MKRIVFVLVLSVFVFSCKKENAASKVKKENVVNAEKRDSKIKGAPVVSFDQDSYDFGVVNEGDVVEKIFKVTNTGKSDLLILDAKATCGCTIPTWPKEAIKPGESSEIQVKFNTLGKPNKQSKTVTLLTNTEKGNEMIRISGMVTPRKKSK